MSRCGEPLRRQTIARRRTAWFGSEFTRVCRIGRTALTGPGVTGQELQRDERRAATGRAVSSRPRRSSSGFWRKRSCPIARYARAPRESRAAHRFPARRPLAAHLRERALVGQPAARRASASFNGDRRAADLVAGRLRRPIAPTAESAPGALLLEDVRRPAGDPRAGEHRGSQVGRNLGQVEDDGGVELDVRRDHVVGLVVAERGKRGLLERRGNLEAGRAELFAVCLRMRERGSSAR